MAGGGRCAIWWRSSRSSGPTYRRTVKATLERLLHRPLPARADRTARRAGVPQQQPTHRPVLDALDCRPPPARGACTYYPDGETVPQHRAVLGTGRRWCSGDTATAGARVVRAVYEICTFQALREQLRCKEIWVVGADRWRNPDEDLPADFESTAASSTTPTLRKPLDPSAFIDELRGRCAPSSPHCTSRGAELAVARRSPTAARSGAIKLTAARGRSPSREPAPAQGPGRSAVGHRRADRHAQGGDPAHRLPGRAHAPAPAAATCPARSSPSGCCWPSTPTAPTPGSARSRRRPGHSETRLRYVRRRYLTADVARAIAIGDRQRHVRRPPAGGVGRRVHRGGVGLHALRGVRPEHLHRVALPLRRPRRADLLARGDASRWRSTPS